MDRPLLKLITRATREGLRIRLHDGRPEISGTASPQTIDALRARRYDILELLTGNCTNCGAEPWIREAHTDLPWCRPCANQRGLALLRHEHPQLLHERTR